MIKIYFQFVFLLLLMLSGHQSTAQTNYGSVYADTNNLYIIKVQGTHYQRGFAQGELLGSRITDIMQNYVKPSFGAVSIYNQVRSVVAAGNVFVIDSLFIVEAKALIDGMNSVGSNSANLDYIDILLSNSILDIKSIMQAKGGIECSSLMSWGSATASSAMNGKSVISRHLDWVNNSVLTRNQVMVIHIPSEANEQAWAEIGFAGMISVLSGFNANLGVFQHMMSDDLGHGTMSGSYEPIWFTLRKAIERIDPNQDGNNNVSDLKFYINQQSQGFADGYIISALAKSTEINDSLIALVAEIASNSPTITYRSNSFLDSIPNDNLYTANNQIARNNSMNFCNRYNGIRNNIGNGTSMSLANNRTLMKNYSYLVTNYQFMTFAPEMNLFRVSIRNANPAYMNPYFDLDISNMFSSNVSIDGTQHHQKIFKIYPNPANTSITLLIDAKTFHLRVSNIIGKIVIDKQMNSTNIDISHLPNGIYNIQIIDMNDHYMVSSFIKE